MRYLDFYKVSILLGRMPISTMCPRFEGKEIYELFRPSFEDRESLGSEGKTTIAWGSDSIEIKGNDFTELRQNIILFCAAINNEL